MQHLLRIHFRGWRNGSLVKSTDCFWREFDPPHLVKVGENSWLAKKYGKLSEDWPRLLKQGFNECFRVLDDYGVLVFKWNEDQVTVKEVLKAIDRQPLFGHTTGRSGKTMWMCFMKLPNN